jgi:hypothetical protein
MRADPTGKWAPRGSTSRAPRIWIGTTGTPDLQASSPAPAFGEAITPSWLRVPSGKMSRPSPAARAAKAARMAPMSASPRSTGMEWQARITKPKTGLSKSDRRAMKEISRGRQEPTRGGSSML